MGQAVQAGHRRRRRRDRHRVPRTARRARSGAGSEDPPRRLVATDLDGTLVRSDGSVSAYTREVLTALEDRGVPVVFVTGRPLRWAEDVFEHVGGHGLAIVSNGALVWDVAPARRSTCSARSRPRRRCEVCRLLREAVPGSTFAVETLDGIGLEPEFMERHPVPDGARRGPIEELLSRPAAQAAGPPRGAGAAGLLGRGRGGGRPPDDDHLVLDLDAARDERRRASPRPPPWRCSPPTWASTPDEVIAFGDMPNDLPMLAWAGTSYAMADAHPSVRGGGRPRGARPRRGRRGTGAGWSVRPVTCCDGARDPSCDACARRCCSWPPRRS